MLQDAKTTMANMREEADSLGVVQVPVDKLWGAQTHRSECAVDCSNDGQHNQSRVISARLFSAGRTFVEDLNPALVQIPAGLFPVYHLAEFKSKRATSLSTQEGTNGDSPLVLINTPSEKVRIDMKRRSLLTVREFCELNK